MWTRKAALLLTSGISLVLIGMMIANFQLMILGLMFIAFLAINSWVSGHGNLEIVRTLSADNLYKGDDLYVELAITNSSFRRTQQLEVFDNVPHEMKLRSGLASHQRGLPTILSQPRPPTILPQYDLRVFLKSQVECCVNLEAALV